MTEVSFLIILGKFVGIYFLVGWIIGTLFAFVSKDYEPALLMFFLWPILVPILFILEYFDYIAKLQDSIKNKLKGKK
jgi:hypothetical protein